MSQYPTLDRTPKTSQTQRPGYVPNVGLPGITNAEWRDAFIEWAAYKWANSTPEQRQTFLGNSWNTSQFGSPDATDGIVTTVDPVTGQTRKEAKVSRQTMLALARFASQYQGGDPEIEAEFGPFQPAGQGEYIESPSETAARLEVEDREREFGRTLREDERNEIYRNALLEQNRNELAADIFNTQSNFASDIFGTQGSIYGNQVAGLTDIFGTQGSIYNNQIGNQANIFNSLADYLGQSDITRQGSLGDAGALATSLQQLLDSRVNEVNALRANPGNYIQAEYASRSLNPPPDFAGPTYSDTGSIQEIINRLRDFQPSPPPATPGFYNQTPTPPTAPQLPTPPSAPSAPASPPMGGSPSPSGGTGQTASQTPPPSSPPGSMPEDIARAIETYSNLMRAAAEAEARGDTATAQQSRAAAEQMKQGTDAAAKARGITVPWPSSFGTARPTTPTWVNTANANQGSPFYNPNQSISSFPSVPANSPSSGSIASIINQQNLTKNQFNRPGFGLPFYAAGGYTNEKQFMTGDVHTPGQPNPEVIDNPTGAPIGVTNEQGIMEKIQLLQQELQETQDPEEVQLITEMIEHYQSLLEELQLGKQAPPGMHQMPDGSMMSDRDMPAYARGSLFGNRASFSNTQPTRQSGSMFGSRVQPQASFTNARQSNLLPRATTPMPVTSLTPSSMFTGVPPRPKQPMGNVADIIQSRLQGFNKPVPDMFKKPIGTPAFNADGTPHNPGQPPLMTTPAFNADGTQHNPGMSKPIVTMPLPFKQLNPAWDLQSILSSKMGMPRYAMGSFGSMTPSVGAWNTSVWPYQYIPANQYGANNINPGNITTFPGMPQQPQAQPTGTPAPNGGINSNTGTTAAPAPSSQSPGPAPVPNATWHNGQWMVPNTVNPGPNNFWVPYNPAIPQPQTPLTPPVSGGPAPTPPALPPTPPPTTQPPVNTLPDTDYQNQPWLRFLQNAPAFGGIFNTQSTANAPGAFGMQLPEAGALNWQQISQLLKNPRSWELAEAAYRSASRDLPTIASLVRSRAPIGNAVASSIIRTR